MAPTDGFTRVPNALIDHANLTLYEMVVYLVLLRHRDHRTGECFPGLATIADEARVSRRTVIRTIPSLEAKGIIKVSRSGGARPDRNRPNRYTVGIFDTRQAVWAPRSVKGTRRPARSRRTEPSPIGIGDQETLVEPVDNSDPSGDTQSPLLVEDTANSVQESPRGARESPALVPAGHRKKNYLSRNSEEAVTPTFSESGPPHASQSVDSMISFPVVEDHATERQVVYIRDLAIILSHEIPAEAHLGRWRSLSRREASVLIGNYLQEIGRPDEIYYPQPGDATYEALSEAGRAFADSAGDPASVWPYSSEARWREQNPL